MAEVLLKAGADVDRAAKFTKHSALSCGVLWSPLRFELCKLACDGFDLGLAVQLLYIALLDVADTTPSVAMQWPHNFEFDPRPPDDDALAAVTRSHAAMIKLLIKHKAGVNHLSRYGAMVGECQSRGFCAGFQSSKAPDVSMRAHTGR